jgi:hypothetical protein
MVSSPDRRLLDGFEASIQYRVGFQSLEGRLARLAKKRDHMQEKRNKKEGNNMRRSSVEWKERNAERKERERSKSFEQSK